MTYYIAPRFLNKISVHITKNFLDLPGINVPLILGIHGHKGEGKSFQCELVFKRMKVQALHITAGELESPDAGDPARLIRFRYREAADIITKHGKLAVLMINDIDAGAGRVDSGTQYTVNTQLVNATLMNIADNPTNVQLPGSYDSEPLPRVPIIVTGNDFGTLYAPLIRDGRMDKFYWEPTQQDRLEIVNGIFTPDGLKRQEIEQLVSHFEGQSVDFFSALRASIYDEQILAFIEETGFDKLGVKLANSSEQHKFIKPDFRLEHLIEKGDAMVQEQKHIQELRLVAAYNRSLAESNTAQRYGFMPGQPPTSGNGIRHENTSFKPESASSKGVQVTENQRFQGNSTQSNTATLDTESVQQIRYLIEQGYPIGIEHVDRRRFQTGSWQSCGCIQSGNESEAIASLESCLANYAGEYVRLFGIDGNKRRVMETIIQRPE